MSIKNSKKAFKKAKKYIPGGVNSPVRAFSSVGGTPVFIDRGEGAYLVDIDGNRYIDYVQSWGPLILGHAHPVVEEKVIDRVKKGLSYGAPTKLETKLAKRIVELFDFVDEVRFVNSGTEAVMSAIRLARGFTGKDDIVKFRGNYHGHSDALLVEAGSGATTFGKPSSSGVPESFTKHTILAEYNSIDSIREAFDKSDNIACVILEPIAGNMGLVPADIEFLQEVRRLCDKHGALLIFDEVMSGFRASLRGAYGIVGIKPDIATFGKVIGGGLPVGAFGGRREIMKHLSPNGAVYQAGTLSGNPIAMSAGLATVEYLIENEHLYAELEAKAKKLMKGFKKVGKEFGIDIQTAVRGSMFGFFFNSKKVKNYEDAKESDLELFARFHQGMLKEGVYLACSQFETGFISEPITDAMIEYTIEAARTVLEGERN